MTDTGILIITVGVVLSVLIICITNFICNYYNDWKDEKIKYANKVIKSFDKKHIHRNSNETLCSAKEEDVIELLNNLHTIL